MGLLDKVKDMLGGNKDKVVDGVDKATDVIDEKTGGEHTEKLDKVDEVVADQVEKLDGGE